jgi:PmbA protein
VKNGVWQSFILGLYGSKKTGLPRSVNSGYYWEVEAGNTELDEMVKSTQKGILMCRFSGGSPAQNGDFSGVAKNSYYIEDGKIQFPISETMVAGNIAELLLNIVDISEERIHFGSSLMPWVKVAKLDISELKQAVFEGTIPPTDAANQILHIFERNLENRNLPID